VLPPLLLLLQLLLLAQGPNLPKLLLLLLLAAPLLLRLAPRPACSGRRVVLQKAGTADCNRVLPQRLLRCMGGRVGSRWRAIGLPR